MSSAVNFILESGISLALLSMIYVFFLRKETFFKLNRLFLLGSLFFSIILPFLKFQVLTPKPTMLSEITVTPYRNLLEAVTIYGKDLSGNVEAAILSTQLIIFLYIFGVTLFLGRFLFRIWHLILLIRNNQIQEIDGIKLVVMKNEKSPFSFMDYIFISTTIQQNRGYERMIAHEMEHVRQGHSFDVIIIELLTIFQWFNPFMWMLRHAIRENHEYLADNAVLTSGVNPGYYKKLLLEQFIGEQLVITNNFNYSLIKNRIKMMSKIKSSKLAFTKYLPGVFVAIALMVIFACEQKESVGMSEFLQEATGNYNNFDVRNQSDLTSGLFKNQGNLNVQKSGLEYLEDSLNNLSEKDNGIIISRKLSDFEEVFYMVEEMPEFPGGDTELRKFIAKSVIYPAHAVKEDIQGKVHVTFVVTRNGEIADARIARGVHPLLDKEALRVINKLPKWNPGKQGGEAVNVEYTVPIKFALQ